MSLLRKESYFEFGHECEPVKFFLNNLNDRPVATPLDNITENNVTYVFSSCDYYDEVPFFFLFVLCDVTKRYFFVSFLKTSA